MSYSEIWKNLSAVDCSGQVETKGSGKYQLSYLSWAWAWGILMEHYPQAIMDIGEDRQLDNGTVEVRITVKIDDCERMMWLPVMDNRNNSIQHPTTRQISDARMRCLVKCLALYGLGYALYAGSDLQSSEDAGEGPAKVTAEQANHIAEKLSVLGDNIALSDFWTWVGVEAVQDIHAIKYDNVLAMLNRKIDEVGKVYAEEQAMTARSLL